MKTIIKNNKDNYKLRSHLAQAPTHDEYNALLNKYDAPLFKEDYIPDIDEHGYEIIKKH